MTDVNQNRWGGTNDPPERDDDKKDEDLKAGGEVRRAVKVLVKKQLVKEIIINHKKIVCI